MRRLRNDASRLYWDAPEGSGGVLVHTSRQAYRRFGRRIDSQLAALVDCWARPAPVCMERMESFAAGPEPK